MDLSTIILMACAALLALAAVSLMGLVQARREVARLRTESEEARRGLDRAMAEGQGHLARVGDRDARLTEMLADVAALRASHRDAEARCSDAETRCAKASEGGQRLEASVLQLREDHARAIASLREDHDRILQGVREEAQTIRARLRTTEEDLSRLGAAHAELQAKGGERLASAEREVASLKAVREDMIKEFRDLANRSLQETGTQFSQSHHQKLQELLLPFREQVNRFETELREVHTTAKVDRELLAQQIVQLTSRTDAVSQEALNLTRALKGDKQRQGAWGEVRLEEYLVHMGLQKGVHYFVQAARTDEDGNDYRPDFILRMPDGKCIVIDSKVSLVSYSAAMEATTEEDRTRHLRDHVRAVRSHIDLLSAKAYERLEQGSVNWVMMFMPIEGAVSAAWAHEADIGTYAMDRNIGIAYPTTLLMALKTFDQLWKIEQRNKNADKIADRAGKLYDKLAGVIDSFKRLGGALEGARSAYGETMGRLSEGQGNLVSQVDQLKKLGAKTNKSMALTFDDDAPSTGEDGPQDDAAGSTMGAGGPAEVRILPAAE